jgi:TetR/AcrR family transcriptional regulator
MNDAAKPALRRTGRPRKDADRADAREQLLDAAHELMCERSTIDVPVKEISDRAGLNVALINYYFKGKDGMLLQMAMRHQSSYAAVLLRLLDADYPAAAKLGLHIRGMVRAFRRVPYLQRLQHKILRDSSEDEARQVAVALIQPLAEFYRHLVRQGVADGSLRPVDPMHLHITIVGACDMLYSGSASRSYGFGVHDVSDELSAAYADHLIALVMQGLKPA